MSSGHRSTHQRLLGHQPPTGRVEFLGRCHVPAYQRRHQPLTVQTARRQLANPPLLQLVCVDRCGFGAPGIGHRFSLEPPLVAWERNKPAWVKLKRLPIIWNEVTREDARLYFTIEGLGLVDKLHSEVFRELHVRGRPLTIVRNNRVDLAATEKAAREFLMSRGVSAEDFARHYRTFSAENKLRQAENLARRYQLDHTPMVVVQGKYVTDVEMAGGPDKLFELINDLASREHGAS